ncbi:porin, partial [Acinetobacter baumannii]
MNKKVIALALLGLGASVAHAQSSVTIYGIVDTSLSYSSNVKNAAGTSNGSRFGVES